MPLRSVEAATRDDAIAAAREQFGPTARVVGVRRVRSGGVLGFFATERYVAEVAADTAGRPAVPVSAATRDETGRDESPADFSSPLASAAPARARAAAPARNGAAAWAAEAARSSRDLPAPASSPAMPRVTSPTPAAAWPAASASRTATPARTDSRPAVAPSDQERVSELAGLLAAQATTPEMPAHPRASYQRAEYQRAEFQRAEFQRAGSPRPRDEGPDPLDDDLSGGRNGFAVPAAPASAAPSPFTAALARMVAGDRDVRQAVREALDDPAAPRPRGAGDSWPIRPGALGPADTSVASPATRQKEETVGDQVIAPSTFADRPVEVPAWAAEPEVLAPSGSSREEAIAEVLRSALAQGHSDEALAGILRKVLAGVAPQTALAEPEVPVGPAPEVVLPVDIAGAVAVPPAPEVSAAPVVVEPAPVAEVAAAAPVVPVVEPAPVVAPVAEVQPTAPVAAPAPLFPAAAPVYAPPAPLFSAPAPFYAAPAPYSLPPLFAPSADSMWGDPSPAPLWGEPVTVAVSRTKLSDAPIWAEVAQQDRAVAAPVEPLGAELAVTDDVPSADQASAELVHGDALPTSDDVAAVEPAPVEVTSVEVAPAVVEPAVVEPAVVESAVVESAVVAAEATIEVVEAAPIEAEPVLQDVEIPDVQDVEVAGVATVVEAEVLELEAPEVEATEVEATPIEVAEIETAQEVRAETADVEQVTQVEDELVGILEAELETEGAHVDEVEAEAEIDAEAETEAAVEAAVAESVVETADEAEVAEIAPVLARTASDPAPMMSLDATTVMPPLSLLPPLPSSRGRGRPPVPPASRPLSPRSTSPVTPPPAVTPEQPVAADATAEASDDVPAAPAGRSLATVTRLPVAPLMATPHTPEMPELDTDVLDDVPGARVAEPARQAESAVPPSVAPRFSGRAASGDLQSRLEALGLPGHLLGETFADDVAAQGTYAALTRALSLRLPTPPEMPSGAGEVLFVVGPGFETLRAARSLAASLRLDPDSVQWATRGELAGLAPKASRITTVETAMDRRQDAAASGTVTIVAVDAPLRSDAYWMAQMLASWTPTAVWVVVEATRKPEDLGPWLDGLPRVDAVVVTDSDLSADPAAVLRRVAAPVALLDGVRATPHRWASLLCERLESGQA